MVNKMTIRYVLNMICLAIEYHLMKKSKFLGHKILTFSNIFNRALHIKEVYIA